MQQLSSINLFRPRFEGGQGREDTTINWWRARQIPTYFESCWKVLVSSQYYHFTKLRRSNI
jgi:hypothetical protein